MEVPIPDDDDDNELYAETCPTLHVEADQCWKFEVPICALDVARWKKEAKPHEMSFLVSAAKRQRSEVKLTQLSMEDRERFQQAKLKEVDSWISTETSVKVLRNQIPRENILRSRWILTWKEIDNSQDHLTKSISSQIQAKGKTRGTWF